MSQKKRNFILPASIAMSMIALTGTQAQTTLGPEDYSVLMTEAGLAPFAHLLDSSTGILALQQNLAITEAIQRGTSSVPLLQSFSKEQNLSLTNATYASENAYLLAPGLGSSLGGAYQKITSYSLNNQASPQPVYWQGISTKINQIMAYTSQIAGESSGASKNFYAANGNMYGAAYTTSNPPNPLQWGIGNPRPFLVHPNYLQFTGNVAGIAVSNTEYLSGPIQNLVSQPGFPSAHTAYSSAESVLLALMVPERYQQMITSGANYGLDRNVVGAHWAMDVISGRTIGYYAAAQLLGDNPNYLGTVSLLKYYIQPTNQPSLGDSVTIGSGSGSISPNYSSLFESSSTELRSALQIACGDTIANCAQKDNGLFSNQSANKALVNWTTTYNLPAVYSSRINQQINFNNLGVDGGVQDAAARNAGFLIWTRFPYLTNAQRNDVISTTLSYGGGFLDDGFTAFGAFSRINLFAAGSGYGAFNDMTGDVSITMDASKGGFYASDTWSNDIGGNKGFTLNGTGIMTFVGANTYTGPTIVNGGALIVDGSITSNVTVNSGGLLGGHGSFGGGIISAGGFISPGNSPGTITSNGNLTLQQGSTYLAEVDGQKADKIAVNGTASVNGASLILNTRNPAYLAGRKFSLLNATGVIAGSFGSLTSLQNYTFLNPNLNYDANNTYVDYGLTPFSTVAKNINQRNVGNALTIAALGPVNALGAPILNALFSGNYQNAQAVMDTVSGSGLAGVQSTAIQVGEMASSSVSDQIAFWRSGETMDATGRTSQEGNNPRNFLSYAPVQRNVPAKGPITIKGPTGGLAAAYAPRTFRAWGSMFGGGANYLSDAGRGAAASNIGYYGGLIGVDYQIQPNILVGVALGGSSSSFNVGSLSTNGNLTGFHAGVYGAYTMGNSYIALNETFSAYTNQTSRKAGGYAYMPYEQLSAQFDSTEFRTRAEVGHGVLMGGLKATPFIAAEIAAYQSNAFSEQSSIYTSTFALKNNGQGINSLPTFAGLRLSNAVTLSNGWRLAPVGSVAYVHEFFPQRQFNNILMSMPGADFNVAGPRSTYNLVQTKVGAQLNLNEKLALFTDFQGEFSPVSQSYGGKGGVKYVW
jgi:outer membrane autotransporter protein